MIFFYDIREKICWLLKGPCYIFVSIQLSRLIALKEYQNGGPHMRTDQQSILCSNFIFSQFYFIYIMSVVLCFVE